mgnify:CR=1 FL=1
MEPEKVKPNLYSPEERDELFNTLADWEAQLSHLDIEAIPPQEPKGKPAKPDLNKRLPL